MPEPTVDPWMETVVRSATLAMARPALRCSRTRWAVTGSGRVPNSSRSPPATERRPRTAQDHLGDRWVDHRHRQGRHQLVAHGRVEGVEDLGPVEGDREPVTLAGDQHRGSAAPLRPTPGCGRPATGRTRAPLEEPVGDRLGHQPFGHRPSGPLRSNRARVVAARGLVTDAARVDPKLGAVRGHHQVGPLGPGRGSPTATTTAARVDQSVHGPVQGGFRVDRRRRRAPVSRPRRPAARRARPSRAARRTPGRRASRGSLDDGNESPAAGVG